MAIDTLGVALRHLNHLFSEGVVAGLSDAQLLDRFLAQGDAEAFEALVARHRPMVLSVCRAILRDPRDVEDAFQATFLVLVKNGGMIRERDALAGWLHRVAHRVAIRANAAAARRRLLERRVGQMTVAASTNKPAASNDLLPALHEEIARLPQKYRLAVVHCDLERMTQAQAAGQLHCSERTLRHRLTEGRARLKRQLTRRGLAPGVAPLGAVLRREARAAVPAAWCEATLRAAVATVNRTVTVGVVSAAAQQLAGEVIKVMLLRKLAWASATLLAAGLIGWGASAPLLAWADAPQKVATALAQKAAPPGSPRPEPNLLDAVGSFPIRGRVIDPDGRPVGGAAIYVRPFTASTRTSANSVAKGQIGRVAISGADGHFRFELDKASSDSTWTDDPAWHEAEIAAVAPGFGPAWIKAGTVASGGEATLRVVRDDVPVRGRLLNSQGRPAAGVVVRIERIGVAPRGTNPDTLLASGEVDRNMVAQTWSRMNPTWYDNPSWLDQQGTWTTDAEGRFEIRGIGCDRIVHLKFESPALEHAVLYAMARRSHAPTKRRPHLAKSNSLLVDAVFDHVLGPTKLITGVVRLKGTTKPLAGVSVWGTERTSGTHVSALTDAQGRFRIVGLPKSQLYEISAQPQSGVHPFLPNVTVVTDTAGLNSIETTLELPKGIIVIGRLIDKTTGRPVPAKYVQWSTLPSNPISSDSALSQSSMADPVFRLTVLPGAGVITAKVLGDDSIYTCAGSPRRTSRNSPECHRQAYGSVPRTPIGSSTSRPARSPFPSISG